MIILLHRKTGVISPPHDDPSHQRSPPTQSQIDLSDATNEILLKEIKYMRN